MGPTDHMPLGESISVLNSCMAVPAATVPAYILSVTSPPPASATPLKEGVWLMLSLPVSGLAIVTLGGAARAVQTGHDAKATINTTAARRNPLAALLVGDVTTALLRLVQPRSLGGYRGNTAGNGGAVSAICGVYLSAATNFACLLRA